MFNGVGNSKPIKSVVSHDSVIPTFYNVDYYGEIPASDFFTGDELSTLLGVTEGELQNSDTDWFKFGLGDKIIFIPKLALRHSISWDHLYSNGLVYGTDDYGLAPTGTPTNQLRIVSKDGFKYKVRLIRGSSRDPHNGTLGGNLAITQGSEWNELMYRVSSANPIGTSENFTMYSDTQLNISSGNGRYTWCQEQYRLGSTYRVVRGSHSAGCLNNFRSSYTAYSRGWRPVLELIK